VIRIPAIRTLGEHVGSADHPHHGYLWTLRPRAGTHECDSANIWTRRAYPTSFRARVPRIRRHSFRGVYWLSVVVPLIGVFWHPVIRLARRGLLRRGWRDW